MTKSTKTNVRNKDLLREIHASKKTYCWFESPEYANYDVIIRDLVEITPEMIDEAIRKKKAAGAKIKLKLDVTVHDLVFRVMTTDHIPIAPDPVEPIPIAPVRKRKPRNPPSKAKKYSKTNFPPFKHYVLRNGVYVEVGRSHWKGDVETGEFSTTHGRITNNLAMLLMKLVEGHGKRSNWVGYSYVDEMKGDALVRLIDGGLMFDESKGNNPFAYYWTLMSNAFIRRLATEKKAADLQDELMMASGQLPSHSRVMSDQEEQRAAMGGDTLPATKTRRWPKKTTTAT